MSKLIRPDGTVTGIGNCGVVALAAATGMSYASVWEWFKTKGGRTAHNWLGGTTWKERQAFLQDNRIAFDIYTGIDVRRDFGRINLQSLCRLDEFKGYRLIATTTGHVQAMQDGLVLDQTTPEAVPVAAYWGRRKFITNIVVLHD